MEPRFKLKLVPGGWAVIDAVKDTQVLGVFPTEENAEIARLTVLVIYGDGVAEGLSIAMATLKTITG